MNLIYIFLLLIIPGLATAQTIKVKGRVVEEVGGIIGAREEKPVPDLSLRFIHYGDCSTTKSGEFIINVPKGVYQLEVEIKDDRTWILRYPRKPFPIPADPYHVTYIYVSRTAEKLIAKETGPNE